MKFTLSRQVALTALSAVQQAVGSSSVPIMRHVLLQAADDILDITAMNGELQVRHTIPGVAIEREGAITVPADKLRDSIASLADGADFLFDFDPSAPEQRATLKSGRARFTMVTLPAGDFPTLAEDASAAGFTLDAASLLRLFTVGGACAAVDKVRAYLGGVFVHDAGGCLRMVSTDAKRMSWADKRGVEGIDGWKGVILSTSTVGVVTRLLNNEDPEVKVTMDAGENRVMFGIGRSTVISKVIGGDYVAYQRIAPTSFSATATADTDMVIAALGRAMVMMDGATSRVSLQFERDGIGFTTSAVNAGDCADRVSAELTGDEQSFNFNGFYLKDLLSRIRTENVVFGLSPICVTVCETGDSDMFSLLAPQHGKNA